MDKEAVPFLCLLIAACLIYVPRLFVVKVLVSQPGGLDNANPRAQQTQLTGLGARAQGAHQNSLETFAPFAAGVLACKAAGVDADEIVLLSVTFVALRVVYIGLYLGNKPSARSTVWILGFLCTLALLVLPMMA